jgi:3-dehydroquinate synthase
MSRVVVEADWTVDVATEHPYPVRVGHRLAGWAPELVAGSSRVAIIHQPTCLDLVSTLERTLHSAGFEVHRLPVPDGEEAKTVHVLAYCWTALGRAGFTRSDSIVGVGGGAATDLAGFVAASWLRGVRLVTVPTSLLGMTDAAVGGKTGINTSEGKNLVGAFHEPAGVLCDLNALNTLPRPDMVAGLAEVIKCGFIADSGILDLVEHDPDAVLDPSGSALGELVHRSIAVKAGVVAGDLRERTSTEDAIGRELLNYGHTLAHAIEQRERYRWRHGDAVAVGMIFVAELSRLAGYASPSLVARHRDVLNSVGLPASYPGAAFDELLATMRLDKKTRGDQLRFVILEGQARPKILTGPDRRLLRSAYQTIAD